MLRSILIVCLVLLGFVQTSAQIVSPYQIRPPSKTSNYGDSLGIIAYDTVENEFTWYTFDPYQDLTFQNDSLKLSNGGTIYLGSTDTSMYKFDGSFDELRTIDGNGNQLRFEDAQVRINAGINEQWIQDWTGASTTSYTLMSFWRGGVRKFRIFGGTTYGLTFYNDVTPGVMMALKENKRIGFHTSAPAREYHFNSGIHRWSSYGDGLNTTSSGQYLLTVESDGDVLEMENNSTGTKVLASTDGGAPFWKTDDTLNPDSVATDGYVSNITLQNDSLKITGTDQAFTGDIDLAPYAEHIGNTDLSLTANRELALNGKTYTINGSTVDFYMTSSGFVGIGTNNPSQELEVTGELELSDATNRMIFYPNLSGVGQLQILGDGANGYDALHTRTNGIRHTNHLGNTIFDLVSGGNIQLPMYGDGLNTGTETYYLGVDSDGDVIDVVPVTNNNQLTNGAGYITTQSDDQTLIYTNTDVNDGEFTLQIEGHSALTIADNHLGTIDQNIDGLTRDINLINDASLRIDADVNIFFTQEGRIGIGRVPTSKPLEILGDIQLFGSGAELHFTNTPDLVKVGSPSSNTLSFYTSGVEHFKINSLGQLLASSYGDGTQGGTVAKTLAVQTNGLVITYDDNDTSATNEFQDISFGPGTGGTFIELDISDGTGVSFDVADNDNSTSNEIQTISKNGNSVSLNLGGGSIDLSGYLDNTVLTEEQVEDYAFNLLGATANGIDLIYTDNGGSPGSIDATLDFNELATGTPATNDLVAVYDLSGTTYIKAAVSTIQDGYNSAYDTEAEIDAAVSNNGYLTSEVDGSTTNEIQTIDQFQIISNEINLSLLSDGVGPLTVDLSPYLDNTVLTEEQVEDYAFSTLGTSAGGADLLYNDNGASPGNIDVTLDMQELGEYNGTVDDNDEVYFYNISSSTLSRVDVSKIRNDADASATNEIQTLTVQSGTTSTSVVDLTGGNDFTLIAGTNMGISENTTAREITLTAVGDGYNSAYDTEAEIDAAVSNNGYLTSEVDGSTSNEIQTISKNGNSVSLNLGGGSIDLSGYLDNTVLTEEQVEDYAFNLLGATANGIDLIYTDNGGSPGSIDATLDFNELATGTPATNDLIAVYDLSGTTYIKAAVSTIQDGYNSAYDTEAEIDAAVSNNGYLTSEVDGSTTNEIQFMSGFVSGDEAHLYMNDNYNNRVEIEPYGIEFSAIQTGAIDRMSIELDIADLSIVTPNPAQDYIAFSDNGATTRRTLLSNIQDGYNSAYDTEAEIDAAVSNNGYLTSEVDGSTTNEIQNLDNVLSQGGTINVQRNVAFGTSGVVNFETSTGTDKVQINQAGLLLLSGSNHTFDGTITLNGSMNSGSIAPTSLRIPVSASPPSSPSNGQIYFDTSVGDRRIWVYYSGVWHQM